MGYERKIDSAPAVDDRRAEGRAATVFRPVLIETEDFAGFCLVRNISPAGLMGDVYTEFASDLPVTILFGGGISVTGTLIWCAAGRIGVQFAHKIDVADVLTAVAKRELEGRINRAPRLAIQSPGYFLIGNRSLAIRVQDISQRGIKAEAGFVQAGDEVWVQLEGLEQRKAVVRWTQDQVAGLNFIRPLSFEELAQWVVHQHLDRNQTATVSLNCESRAVA